MMVDNHLRSKMNSKNNYNTIFAPIQNINKKVQPSGFFLAAASCCCCFIASRFLHVADFA